MNRNSSQRTSGDDVHLIDVVHGVINTILIRETGSAMNSGRNAGIGLQSASWELRINDTVLLDR